MRDNWFCLSKAGQYILDSLGYKVCGDYAEAYMTLGYTNEINLLTTQSVAVQHHGASRLQ